MSDVLIKNMKMPSDGCKDCIFVNRKWHGDICPILKRDVSGNVERGGFQTDCPLIEVPKHGRLIDADELKHDFPHDEDWDYPVNTNSWVNELIDKAPTIFEAEEGE